MERMGMIRRGGMLVLVGVFGLSLFLGGCAKDKQRADAAQQEAAELREKNAQLEQANRDTAARLAEIEAQRSAAANNMDDSGPTTGNNPASRRTARTTGSEGNLIKRSHETGLPTATIGGDVLFGSGSDAIKPEAKKVLDKIATEIKTQYGGASIRVEGYTDSDPIKKSKWGTNEKLSQARADSVRKYLVNKGVKAGHIEAMGYGASNPKASKAESRRVEIVVVQ
jgi:outer membrane protein OmpA-like peptidoglycan-associated protein